MVRINNTPSNTKRNGRKPYKPEKKNKKSKGSTPTSNSRLNLDTPRVSLHMGGKNYILTPVTEDFPVTSGASELQPLKLSLPEPEETNISCFFIDISLFYKIDAVQVVLCKNKTLEEAKNDIIRQITKMGFTIPYIVYFSQNKRPLSYELPLHMLDNDVPLTLEPSIHAKRTHSSTQIVSSEPPRKLQASSQVSLEEPRNHTESQFDIPTECSEPDVPDNKDVVVPEIEITRTSPTPIPTLNSAAGMPTPPREMTQDEGMVPVPETVAKMPAVINESSAYDVYYEYEYDEEEEENVTEATPTEENVLKDIALKPVEEPTVLKDVDTSIPIETVTAETEEYDEYDKGTDSSDSEESDIEMEVSKTPTSRTFIAEKSTPEPKTAAMIPPRMPSSELIPTQVVPKQSMDISGFANLFDASPAPRRVPTPKAPLGVIEPVPSPAIVAAQHKKKRRVRRMTK
ncbi:hypothetical protein PCE1_000785 [Barthelona sp. PCE]